MRLRSMPYVLLGLLALGAAGCGHVHEVYYTRNVQYDPAAAEGLRLDQVYAAPDIAKIRDKVLAIQVENPARTIQRNKSKISKMLEKGDEWVRSQRDLEALYAASLRRSGLFKQVESYGSSLLEGTPDLVMRIAVTQWHEGNKWGRAFLGLGVGHTRVQYEGQLTEVQTGKVLFAFADARVHPGGPSLMGPLDKKPWKGSGLIAEDLLAGTKDVVSALKIAAGAGEPPE